MNRYFLAAVLCMMLNFAYSQNLGIVRKNYTSSYFDSTLNTSIQVLDSATIRLGSIDPISGAVTNLGNTEYNLAINLNGATINPYSGQYYIGSGFNLLTFDMNSGSLLNNVPIAGAFASGAVQNYRFNPGDTMIYGMVPNNFYSSYFDSTLMMTIDVLDSTQIRFGSLDPQTGQYSLIGNYSYNNIYTLAGNSIDPYQMVYYYSAVDTLIGIDLYNGLPYSITTIQLPPNGIFENIVYSCVDTSIYGLTRQNYTSIVYDSLLMDFVEVVDSTTFRLSKIDPNTGMVTFISPYNIQFGGNLTGGAFIDPNSMTYFFNHGNDVVGVSLLSGTITSTATKTFQSGAFAFDMMRSASNCFGASKMRMNPALGLYPSPKMEEKVVLFPNPAQNEIFVQTAAAIKSISVFDLIGNQILISKVPNLEIADLPKGIYLAKVTMLDGGMSTHKFIKN